MKTRQKLFIKSFYNSSKSKKLKNLIIFKKRDIETVLKLNIKNYPSENFKTTNASRNKKIFNNDDNNQKNQTEDGFNTLAISIRKLKTFYPNIKDEVFNENYTNGQIPSRTEHINIEEKLKSKILQISEKEDEMKKNQKDLENYIKNLDIIIDDQQLSIEAITNVDSDTSKKKKYFTEKVINEFNLKNPKEKKNNYAFLNSKEFQEQFNLFLLREDYNTNQKIKEIKDEMEKNKNIKFEKIKELNEINESLKEIHDEKKKEIEELYMHYLKILKEGKDTRNEGLSWIIREIFNLDKKVIISFFPKFLDKLCIKYLFDVTHINMKITEIEKQIKLCQKDFKDKGIIKTIAKKENDEYLTQRNLTTKAHLNKIKRQFSLSHIKSKTKKEDIEMNKEENKLISNEPHLKIAIFLNQIPSPIKKIDKKSSIIKINEIKDNEKEENNLPYINGDPNHMLSGKNQGISYTNKLIKDEMRSSIKIPPIIRIKDFNKMSFIKNYFTSNDIGKVNKFFSLRRQLTILREEKDILKTNEMDRIFKEFQRNNYKQKYNVDKIKVISALIGEDNINNEIFRQERRERLYMDQISKSQLYNKNINYRVFNEKSKNK